MVITALVENTSTGNFRAKHGLSLYIQTRQRRILFDLGPDNTLFENAQKLDIDLSAVDTVILSHGHVDHGGALAQFLKINHTAKVYVQKDAFAPHYSKLLFVKVPIGLDAALASHPQIVLLDGDAMLDGQLRVFTVRETSVCHSTANDALCDATGRDSFGHEQNLLVTEDTTALIMGCGHCGVVNIMKRAEQHKPAVCVGGYHLFNPMSGGTVPKQLLDEIADRLQAYPQTQFYTCHCTGKRAFQYLSDRMPNLSYLSCGQSIEL